MQQPGQQQLQVYQQPTTLQRSSAHGLAVQQQLQPFGPLGASPFGLLDEMLGGGPLGGGALGGGFGGLFAEMDSMMRHMSRLPMDDGAQMMPMGGGCSQVMMMSSSGGGSTYSSQSMVTSSTVGPDGKVHTERYSSSAVGDHGRQISEVQQAYSNSTTGMDKMSLERQMADQARKMVKERNRASGEERSTEMFRGITEEQVDEFDRHWKSQAAPHLPSHGVATSQFMLTGGAAAGASAGPVLAGASAGPVLAGQPGPRAGYPAHAAIAVPTPYTTASAAAQGHRAPGGLQASTTAPFLQTAYPASTFQDNMTTYPVRPGVAYSPQAFASQSYAASPSMPSPMAGQVPPQYTYNLRR